MCDIGLVRNRIWQTDARQKMRGELVGLVWRKLGRWQKAVILGRGWHIPGSWSRPAPSWAPRPHDDGTVRCAGLAGERSNVAL